MRKKASKNKHSTNPSAIEKKWIKWLADRPCCVSGEQHNVSVHHCEGSTFAHNGVHLGHWLQIPLQYEYHQGQLGIHAPHVGRITWTQRYGLQKDHCLSEMKEYILHGGEIPDNVIESIASLRR